MAGAAVGACLALAAGALVPLAAHASRPFCRVRCSSLRIQWRPARTLGVHGYRNKEHTRLRSHALVLGHLMHQGPLTKFQHCRIRIRAPLLAGITQTYTCVQALVMGLVAASAACAVFASQREAYSPLFPKRVFLQHRHEVGRDGRIQVSMRPRDIATALKSKDTPQNRNDLVPNSPLTL